MVSTNLMCALTTATTNPSNSCCLHCQKADGYGLSSLRLRPVARRYSFGRLPGSCGARTGGAPPHATRIGRRSPPYPRLLTVTASLTYTAPPVDTPKARLAVFVSGGGSNFKAIHSAILDGRVNAEVVAVVSDVPGCGGWQYAESHGIPTLIYPIPKKGDYAGQGLSADELLSKLTGENCADYVILAGYLKLIPEGLVRAFKRAMVNIHPALLPSFGGPGCYGARVHKKVVESGVRFSGPTVHFVDEEYDTGAIIAQRVVPVFPTDSPSEVAARVLKEEHKVFPEVVAALVDGRITFRSDGIPMMWSVH